MIRAASVNELKRLEKSGMVRQNFLKSTMDGYLEFFMGKRFDEK
jgi:hypothetical protein